MNLDKLKNYVESFWAEEAIPSLSEFIKIPSKNAAFDINWESNKYLESAANLIGDWIRKQQLPETKVEVLALPGKTPFLYAEILGAAKSSGTVLLYGHLDKMPESEGWSDGYGPWQPVLDKDRLYGRGASDNGGAIFIMLAALKALSQQAIPHAKCVFLFECGEENGSPDFLDYIETLKEKIGTPDLVVCLDSGGDDFEHLWITNSIRGSIVATLNVAMLQQSVHSGLFGGTVASVSRIVRQLLARIENETTGEILLPELNVKIPPECELALKAAAKILGDDIGKSIPLLPDCSAISSDPETLLHKQTWGPSMEVIGINGLPPIEQAGNVLIPHLSLQLNLRLPPTASTKEAITALKKLLENNPPYGAKVSFSVVGKTRGWVMPETDLWLKQVLSDAAEQFFNYPVVYRGIGGSVETMAVFADKFAKAQFVVMGTNCAGANMHGPDEFLHLPTAKKLSCTLAQILAAHYKASVD